MNETTTNEVNFTKFEAESQENTEISQAENEKLNKISQDFQKSQENSSQNENFVNNEQNPMNNENSVNKNEIKNESIKSKNETKNPINADKIENLYVKKQNPSKNAQKSLKSIRFKIIKTTLFLGLLANIIGIFFSLILTLFGIYDPIESYLNMNFEFKLLSWCIYIAFWISLLKVIKNISIQYNQNYNKKFL